MRRGKGGAADLVPVERIDADGTFATTTGRLGRVLSFPGLDLGLAGPEAAAATARNFGALLSGLPDGAELQLRADNGPLSREVWLEGHLHSAASAPPALAPYG